jgi:hypothetical protein
MTKEIYNNGSIQYWNDNTIPLIFLEQRQEITICQKYKVFGTQEESIIIAEALHEGFKRPKFGWLFVQKFRYLH